MFDISLSELLVVAVVALLVLGPDEMPKVLRAVMRFFRSVKQFVAEVQQGVESLADEPEIKEIKHAIQAERRYIIDEAGNYQEVFDISELMKDEEKKDEA